MLVTVTAVSASAATATSHAMKNRCGTLDGKAIYAIESQQASCAVARSIAAAHARSVRRRGACNMRVRQQCRVARYMCVYRIGWQRRARDAFVLCGRTADDKIQFVYDARRFKIPARAPGGKPDPAPQPDASPQPAPASPA